MPGKQSLIFVANTKENIKTAVHRSLTPFMSSDSSSWLVEGVSMSCYKEDFHGLTAYLV